jgi:methylaspartate mutase sigma subunit
VTTIPGSRTDLAEPALAELAPHRAPVLVSSLSSDSHTWNLVFLQLLIEEVGHPVRNLGACVPDELLLEEAMRLRPELIVLSTVNGHGYRDGLRVAGLLRRHLCVRESILVIGGKLGVAGPLGRDQVDDLLRAGFDAVFDDGPDGVAEFGTLVAQLGAGRQP